MKISIETQFLKAETDNLIIAFSLLEILDKWEHNNPDHIADVSNMDSPISKMETTEIPNDKYLTITANEITIGGEKIWDAEGAVCYFKESIPLFKQEHNIDVVELHCLQSSTVGQYATPGNPVPDTNGVYSWCRIKTRDGRLSRWVFRYASSSVADCRSSCALYCGRDVWFNSAFRAGVFGSLGN